MRPGDTLESQQSMLNCSIMVQSVLTTTESRACTLSVLITPTRIDLGTFVQFDMVLHTRTWPSVPGAGAVKGR